MDSFMSFDVMWRHFLSFILKSSFLKRSHVWLLTPDQDREEQLRKVFRIKTNSMTMLKTLNLSMCDVAKKSS